MNIYLFVSWWKRFEAMRSIVYVKLFVASWFAAIGTFLSEWLFPLFDVFPSWVYFVVDQLFWFLTFFVKKEKLPLYLVTAIQATSRLSPQFILLLKNKIGITCDTNKWLAPSNGQISWNCRSATVTSGASCSVTCNNGYELVGSRYSVCGVDGEWNPKTTAICRGEINFHVIIIFN